MTDEIKYTSDLDALDLDEFLKDLDLSQEPSETAAPEPPELPPEPAVPVSPKKKDKPKGRKNRLLIAIAAPVLLILVCFLGYLLLEPNDCKIHDGVSIGGLELEGLNPIQAYRELKALEESVLTSQTLPVSLPLGTVAITPEDSQLELDAWAALLDAYRYGRSGKAETAVLGLHNYLTWEETAIRSKLEAYAQQYNTQCQQPQYVLEGPSPDLEAENFTENTQPQTLLLTMGIPTVLLDVEDTYRQILSVYDNAAAAWNTGTYQVTVASIAPLEIPDLPDLEAIYQEVCTAPVDDTVDMVNYCAIPGAYGYSFDREAAQSMVDNAAYGETLRIPMFFVEPDIFGQEVFFQDVLGSCETKHTTNENRNNNLRLLCAALDGLIVEPGQEFSYNESVGERTTERGYLPAGAYSGTTLVNAVGGGVCQGSTTLYNCVLIADLEVVFRINHGLPVTYVPYGLDATVNWGGPDFKFRNNTHFPIMIKAEVADGYVKMQILGTDEKDYYVEMEARSWREDDTTYARSYKCKYDKETGELISRELEARSSYKHT